jgi:putative transposase
MRRARNCNDNAMVESVLSTPNRAPAHINRFRTPEQARLAVPGRIEVGYQRTGIHGSLGYVSPEAFKAAASVG